MADDLKPCPCCGEDMARVINDNDFFRVRCDYCGLQTEVNYKDEEGAIDSWNMRSSDWHTGTPTYKGRYLVSNGYDTSISYFDGKEFAKDFLGFPDVGDIVKWQKIEP